MEVRYRVLPSLWRWESDGEKKYIIYTSREMKLMLLNPVAAQIYVLLQPGASLDEISEELGRRYPDVPAIKIRHDAKAFIEHLERTGDIIQDRGDNTAPGGG